MVQNAVQNTRDLQAPGLLAARGERIFFGRDAGRGLRAGITDARARSAWIVWTLGAAAAVCVTDMYGSFRL